MSIYMYIRFHIHKTCTFRVTKSSLNISDHVRFQQDSTRMIGQDKSAYGLWLVESFAVSQSCERNILQKSHMITNIKTELCNSVRICPMYMKSFSHIDLTTKLNILPICFVSLTGFRDMDDRNFIVLVGAASHKAYWSGCLCVRYHVLTTCSVSLVILSYWHKSVCIKMFEE